MSGTRAIFVPTEKMYNDVGWSDTRDKLRDESDYAENIFNRDIGTEEKYEISVVYSTLSSRRPTIDDGYDGTCDAKNACLTWVQDNTDLFDDFDAVVVYDVRTFDGYRGCARSKTAGSDEALGYVAGDGTNYQTGTHELGHIYGGKHDRKEPGDGLDSTWSYRNGAYGYQNSLMYSDDDALISCYDDDVHYPRKGWFSWCTKNAAHDCMDGVLSEECGTN